MKINHSLRSRIVPLGLSIAVFTAGLFIHQFGSREVVTAVLADSSTPALLEVTNTHFTRGREVPSVFLKITADGVVYCEEVKFSGKEGGKFKRKKLTAREFDEVKAAVNQSQVVEAEGRYEFARIVIDSWMEWTVAIPRAGSEQHIAIAFARTSDAKDRPHPDALAKLGCLILKLRGEVYGDDTEYYRPAFDKAQVSF
jgi:hypothetical protein